MVKSYKSQIKQRQFKLFHITYMKAYQVSEVLDIYKSVGQRLKTLFHKVLSQGARRHSPLECIFGGSQLLLPNPGLVSDYIRGRSWTLMQVPIKFVYFPERPFNMKPRLVILQVLCKCHKVSQHIHLTVLLSKASHRH